LKEYGPLAQPVRAADS